MSKAVMGLVGIIFVILAWKRGYLSDFYQALQGKWTV